MFGSLLGSSEVLQIVEGDIYPVGRHNLCGTQSNPCYGDLLPKDDPNSLGRKLANIVSDKQQPPSTNMWKVAYLRGRMGFSWSAV